jgi:ATP-dependent helicase YprA (DUF1998 family)
LYKILGRACDDLEFEGLDRDNLFLIHQQKSEVRNDKTYSFFYATIESTLKTQPMDHHATDSNTEFLPPKKPLQQSVRIYKAEELNFETLAAHTKSVLKQIAFSWQLEIGAAVLCGEDIIVDVGTGGGKSLAFSTSLVLHETDIALRVTPLTALMIDQVRMACLACYR